ncbi:MAG: formylglycine-generating enzyme family protein, partial [Proteobacteria bacterium]|nr:formylglycine-generating enzyme family protein [Pseudomonadota bacterium]
SEPTDIPYYYDYPELQDAPVGGLRHHQAEEFCDWDGGRILPTEAQWEKAAKGPYPENTLWPWGDDYPTCEQANFRECYLQNYWGRPMQVDTLPAGISYYGLYHVVGNAKEWVSDYFGESYYASSPETDPLGPDAGEMHSIRSGYYDFDLPSSIIGPMYNVSFRLACTDNHSDYSGIGFRCARHAY